MDQFDSVIISFDFHLIIASKSSYLSKYTISSTQMTSNDVLADQTRVNVLQKPSDFYQALESLITTAKTRLVISALYLGEGHLEAHLLDLIDDAISSKSLKVDIILDHSRFQRDSQSTVRTRLCKIIASHPQNITISLYEMPQLRSFPVSQLPYWLKEIAAVYHCKVRTIMMSLHSAK